MRITTSPTMEDFRNNPRDKLLKIHVAFQYLSPVAIIALLSYFIGTVYFNPDWNIILISRVALTLFFSLEFLVEFILYENKIKFVKHYWWRAGLVVPMIGLLRVVGQLAYLSQLLSVLKMTEETIESLDHYGYIKERE